MNVTLTFPIWLPVTVYLAVGLVVLATLSGALVRDYLSMRTETGRQLTRREALTRMLADSGCNGILRLLLGCVLLWPLMPFPRVVTRILNTVTTDPAVTR